MYANVWRVANGLRSYELDGAGGFISVTPRWPQPDSLRDVRTHRGELVLVHRDAVSFSNGAVSGTYLQGYNVIDGDATMSPDGTLFVVAVVAVKSLLHRAGGSSTFSGSYALHKI